MTRVTGSSCGCFCCSYWIPHRHLRFRNPDRKARAVAHEFKKIHLQTLGEKEGVPLVPSDADEFLDKNPDRSEKIAIFSYAKGV